MTVADLLEVLKNAPLNYKVIMASDAEGNYYSPLAEVDEGCYVPDNAWSGGITKDEDANAIVLTPIN